MAPGSLGSPAGLDRNQGIEADPAGSRALGSFKSISDVKLIILDWGLWGRVGVG